MKTLVSGKGISVFLAEGEEKIVKDIYACLEPLGYELSYASTGPQAWQALMTEAYDVVVLDVMLAGMDGLTLCRRLREEAGNETPVIMLTSSESLENRVLCLNWGADNLIVKPFDMQELEARIRAVVRRVRAPQRSRALRWAGITLDPQLHIAECEGRPLRLRPTSFALLARLMRSAPGVVSRQDLELEIYGGSPPSSEALRAHVHLLRKELVKAGKPILKTVSHVGYYLLGEEEMARQ